jgi:hypothetical protein
MIPSFPMTFSENREGTREAVEELATNCSAFRLSARAVHADQLIQRRRRAEEVAHEPARIRAAEVVGARAGGVQGRCADEPHPPNARVPQGAGH